MVQRGLSGADGTATARNERRDPSGSRLCRLPGGTAASKDPRACLQHPRAAVGPQRTTYHQGTPASTRTARQSSPSTPQTTDFGPFFVRWANYFAHRTPPGATLKPMTPLQPLTQASMKPPSPLRTPEQQPLKPTTPLQPKNAPQTPMPHPQRRQGFQLGLSRRPQRRRRCQTTGPAVPAGPSGDAHD